MDKAVVRGWGSWEVLAEGPGYKVKRLTIEPGQAISLQYHNHRCETWYIIAGEGVLEMGHVGRLLEVGDMVFIDKKATHRVTNTSKSENFVAIEAQLGERTEEDDIVRV